MDMLAYKVSKAAYRRLVLAYAVRRGKMLIRTSILVIRKAIHAVRKRALRV